MLGRNRTSDDTYMSQLFKPLDHRICCIVYVLFRFLILNMFVTLDEYTYT